MQALARSFLLLTLLSVMTISMELAIKNQSQDFEESSSGVEAEDEDYEGYLDFDDYSVDDDDDYDDLEEDEYEYEDDDYEYDE